MVTHPSPLQRALALVDDDWLRRDPDLGPLLPQVLARGVGQDWHKAGTFRKHLVGVTRSLTLWQQPPEVRQLGLLHSVYGNDYVDLIKFDPARERKVLQQAVGEEVERLVYLFCTIPRTQFVQRLLEGALGDRGSLILTVPGRSWTLSARDVAIFVTVTLADMAEQWGSWQDEIFSKYPAHRSHDTRAHWAPSLWPGPMRPSSRNLGLLARLVEVLRHPALAGLLPPPPLFAGSSAQLTPRAEACATALYWSVVQHQHLLVDTDAAREALEQAIALNPWVGEPQLLLAQVWLSTGHFDIAMGHARRGLDMLALWGTAWDKRMAWEAWLAWGRILLQAAELQRWPDDLQKLNNLALAT